MNEWLSPGTYSGLVVCRAAAELHMKVTYSRKERSSDRGRPMSRRNRSMSRRRVREVGHASLVSILSTPQPASVPGPYPRLLRRIQPGAIPLLPQDAARGHTLRAV